MLRHFKPADLSPEQFELTVKDWLETASGPLTSFRASHRERVDGVDGTYEIDVVASFRALGVEFVVLVECKNTRRPIEREVVQVIRDRLRSSGSQKGMIVATAGFQRGAVEYAQVHGIALVTIVEGKALFEARGVGPQSDPPPWIRLPAFAGILTRLGTNGAECYSTVEVNHIDPLREFLQWPEAGDLPTT